MISKSTEAVVAFCLDRANDAPIRTRIELYRGLADLCGSPEESRRLVELAASLEAADQQCREFQFKFTARAN